MGLPKRKGFQLVLQEIDLGPGKFPHIEDTCWYILSGYCFSTLARIFQHPHKVIMQNIFNFVTRLVIIITTLPKTHIDSENSRRANDSRYSNNKAMSTKNMFRKIRDLHFLRLTWHLPGSLRRRKMVSNHGCSGANC